MEKYVEGENTQRDTDVDEQIDVKTCPPTFFCLFDRAPFKKMNEKECGFDREEDEEY